MRSTRELKYMAKAAMRGKTGWLILVMLTEVLLNFAVGTLTDTFFGGSSMLDLIIGQVFSFILSLVFCVVSAGASYIYVNVARGRECSVSDLFFFFRNHPDNVIIASFILSLISLLTSLPSAFYVFGTEIGNTVEAQMSWASGYLAVTVLCMVLNVIFSLPFSMAYYVLADDPELRGMQALKISIGLMKGRKWRYLRLLLSFVPMMVLSAFTLYLALLWVLPYLELSIAEFYRDAVGELKEIQ